MTLQEQAVNRVKQFEQLHEAFYTYFSGKLAKDDSRYAKYRLQLLTVFWEELELTRVVYPLFESFSCTLAEKQAVARAALYDALVAHTFGSYLDQSAHALHSRMDDLEKVINRLETNSADCGRTADAINAVDAKIAKVAAGAEAVVSDFSTRVANLEKRFTGEKTNAIPKRKQAVVRQEAGQQK